MSGKFPSSLERTVASALLLLSEPPSLSPHKIGFDGEPLEEQCESKCSAEESLSLVSTSSKSCSSSITSDCSSQGIRANKMMITVAVARCREMKLKVARRSRSKVYHISEDPKIFSCKPATVSSESVSTVASCLSSSSAVVSSSRSRHPVNRSIKKHRHAMVDQGKQKRTHANPGSTHMRRRAEAILKLLSGGCSSEVKIRQMLGDSPDTSKALRMLLKLEEIKRSGAGGRLDPYIYTIAREMTGERDQAGPGNV